MFLARVDYFSWLDAKNVILSARPFLPEISHLDGVVLFALLLPSPK